MARMNLFCNGAFMRMRGGDLRRNFCHTGAGLSAALCRGRLIARLRADALCKSTCENTGAFLRPFGRLIEGGNCRNHANAN